MDEQLLEVYNESNKRKVKLDNYALSILIKDKSIRVKDINNEDVDIFLDLKY